MTPIIMYGEPVAKEIYKTVKDNVLVSSLFSNWNPIFIQVGDNPASTIYQRNKFKACEDLGMKVEQLKLSANITKKELLSKLKYLQDIKAPSGVMVQFPLPPHISEDEIIKHIEPEYDIDGFARENRVKILDNEPTIYPCTPKAVIDMLDYYKLQDVEGKMIVVAGRSKHVGKPLSLMLENKGATVTTIHSKTPDIIKAKLIADCDIFISAIGKPKYFSAKMLSDYLPLDTVRSKILIDIGINRDEDNKLCGDIDPDLYPYAIAYTPVPKGVGVVTVAEVVANIHELMRGKY